ncbi:MAG: DUF481 domain-containing protein [Planctomycetes bacterium]|nr:DUF481 domain-containing protein [Planctomycetota bacterium]
MYLRFLLLLVLICAPASLVADELTTTDGDTFVGKFEKLENGEVHFTSTSVGLVKVPVAKVATMDLDEERKVRVRTGESIKDQQDATISTEDGKLKVKLEAGELDVESLEGIKGIDETVPDERPEWSFDALLSFGWTEGNTRTYNLGYRFDIKRTTKHNYMTLFGRGSYFQDRNLKEDSVRERQHHFGYLYRYIFDFNLTVEVTEDLYMNELAGYHYRSITGVGPGYYIIRKPKMTWYVAAHLTYTKEDLINHTDDRGFFGARAKTEFDWVTAADMVHINAKSELLLDFAEFKNLVVNSSLLIEHHFASYFTAGLLIEHSWDNIPAEGFKHHDFRFLFTLGISWSGRGF